MSNHFRDRNALSCPKIRSAAPVQKIAEEDTGKRFFGLRATFLARVTALFPWPNILRGGPANDADHDSEELADTALALASNPAPEVPPLITNTDYESLIELATAQLLQNSMDNKDESDLQRILPGVPMTRLTIRSPLFG